MMPIKALRMRNATALWTPASLSVAPKIWLNDDSTVTDAGGGACSQWNDISGNGHNFSQPTSGNRPSIIASGLNGRRVIRFNGTSGFMQSGTGGVLDIFKNVAAAWAISALVKTTDVTEDRRFVFMSATNVGSGAGRFDYAAGFPAAGGANKPYTFGVRTDGGVSQGATGSAARTGAYMYLGACDFAAGSAAIHIDGSLDASSSGLWTGGGNTSNTSAAVAHKLGCNLPGTTGFYDGDIGEIIVGAGSLPTAGEIDKLFGYLAHRWGLAGSLPGGHPYKTAPPTL